MNDPSFKPTKTDLLQGINPLLKTFGSSSNNIYLETFPDIGIGERKTIDILSPIVFGGASHLGNPLAFAHMDPPTPWITWVTTLWNASLNQNLLHPDVSPVARDFETKVVKWIAPFFGMDGGHMTPGATVSNLTALWVARDVAKINMIIASKDAHLSIKKAANILGLPFKEIKTLPDGSIDTKALPDDLSRSALVLTAGTTSTGAIDNLNINKKVGWTHVDAAWAGPLRLSRVYGSCLDGIENANSIAVSGHKWFFQPKESALIFFRSTQEANRTISSSSGYLSTDNVGLLGSHGAIGLPLLATLIAWGRNGLTERLEKSMELSQQLWQQLENHPNIKVFGPPVTGVILWRAKNAKDTRTLFSSLPSGSASATKLNGFDWIRHVAANPQADIDKLWSAINKIL